LPTRKIKRNSCFINPAARPGGVRRECGRAGAARFRRRPRTFIGGAGGGVGDNCGGARLATPYLATRPGAPGFNGFARPVVLRGVLLEVWEHVLGAVGGPKRKRPLILLVEPFGVFNLHRSQTWRNYFGFAPEQNFCPARIQPGGQARWRPPRMWTCRCGTVSPPSAPLLMTSR
jgi:hypothetical protein